MMTSSELTQLFHTTLTSSAGWFGWVFQLSIFHSFLCSVGFFCNKKVSHFSNFIIKFDIT